MTKQKKLQRWQLVLGVVIILFWVGMLMPLFFSAKMNADPPLYGQGAWYVRAINTSQVTYSINYENIGYAPNLAVLGPAGNGECGAKHACVIDAKLGCVEGVGQEWCLYEGYRFNIQSSSPKPPYKDYWITATPIEANPKLKNYCSAEDVVVRVESAPPLSRPYTRVECLSLKPEE